MRAGDVLADTLAGGPRLCCGALHLAAARHIAHLDVHQLTTLPGDPDPVRATAAAEAMLGMRKIVIAELEDAVR